MEALDEWSLMSLMPKFVAYDPIRQPMYSPTNIDMCMLSLEDRLAGAVIAMEEPVKEDIAGSSLAGLTADMQGDNFVVITTSCRIINLTYCTTSYVH